MTDCWQLKEIRENMSTPWTAHEVTQLLRERYSGREWAFVTEVPNGTGVDMTRRCDGLAMSLWPSKGLYLHGHEIKVRRGDWLTEIQDVSKSAAFSQYCHYWWIVAPLGVVKLEELPGDWGLMCPTASGGLRAKKPAALTTPMPPSHSLVAGIFRACCKASTSEVEITAARDSGYSAGYAEARKFYVKSVEQSTDNRRCENLKRSVENFETASGIHIDAYKGRQLGELVRIVQSAAPDQIRYWLDRVAVDLAKTHERVVEASNTLGRMAEEKR